MSYFVPLFHMFPRTKDLTFTKLDLSLPYFKSFYYIKIPIILSFDGKATGSVARTFKREIETMEILAKTPHPNILMYYVCITEGDYVSGICLERRTVELYERIRQSKKLHIEKVIDQVHSVLHHPHGICLLQ